MTREGHQEGGPQGKNESDMKDLGEEYFRQGTSINAQRMEKAWTVPETAKKHKQENGVMSGWRGWGKIT